MKRIKIELQKEPIDIYIERMGLIALILLIVLPIYFYNQLPDVIPTHYGSDGVPNGYGKKSAIWTLPIIATVIFVGLTWLNQHPEYFNTPRKVTKDNAKRLYSNMTRIVRSLNTIITCVGAYLTYSTIQIALGNMEELGTYFAPVFLIMIVGILVYSIFLSIEEEAQD